MDGKKILGILLIVGGLAAVFYGHLSYTREAHEAHFGKLLPVRENNDLAPGAWAALAAFAAGAVVRSAERRKPRARASETVGLSALRRA